MNDSTPLSGLAKQLVLNELLDEKTARQAQVQAARNKQSLVSHLVQAKLVQSRALVEVAAEQFGIAYCDLNSLDRESIPKDAISERLVRQHRVLPLWKRGNKLFIGLSDPTNHQAVTDIQFSTGLTTEALLVEDDKLGVAIEKLYEGAMDALGDLGDIDLDGVDVGKAESASQEDSGDDAEDAPVVRFVNKMLLDAIRGGSSDLHFEPYEKTYRVRFRTDGMLHEVAKPPIQLASRISARLKVMAGLDISERRKPQDGRIKMRVSKNKSIDFRVNTLPTLWGEKIVMRILDSSSAQMGIDALGYEEDQKELYLAALKQPQGMILVTGPHRLGQDGFAVHRPEHPEYHRHQHFHRRRPGGDQPGRHQPGQRQSAPGHGLLPGAARLPAPGPGRDHGRRDPRSGDCRDRHQGGADRAYGDVHPAHQQRRRDPDPPAEHGRAGIQPGDLGEPDHRPAPCAKTLFALQERTRRAEGNPASRGLPGRQDRHLQAVFACRLRKLQRRLQRSRRYL